MIEKESEASLLKRAGAEEKAYNWVEAARLYEQAAEYFLSNKVIVKAAEIYKKLGYANLRAANTSETAEEYKKRNQNAVKAYNNAAILFKKIGDKCNELECNAEMFYTKGMISTSIIESKKRFNKSYELFSESSELNSSEHNQEGFLRTLSRTTMTLSILIYHSSDRKEIEELHQIGIDIASKVWKLSKDIKNIQTLTESLFGEMHLVFLRFLISFKKNMQWKEFFKNLLSRSNESIRFAKGCDDSRILGIIYFVAGFSCWYLGFHFINDEKEQSESIDKSLELLKKALVFAKKAKDKPIIILIIFFLNFFALFGGRFKYIQKRIFKDMFEILEIDKIYTDLFNPYRFPVYILPTLYYSQIAQMKFFTTNQRKFYAKKGIEYAKDLLKLVSPMPFSAWAYQALTWSYSQLVASAASNMERDEYAQKMFHYAKEAEKIAEKYGEGYPRSSAYSSLYRANKTLADIAKNEEDKIKMLSAATDASKNYIESAVESRTGILTSQMRLALLYEELGITTGNNDILTKAIDSLLNIVKESSERDYFHYSAAANEYIARIEDRLGNYSVSAEYYEKALESHTESLKTAKYKPLIIRIKEKINYCRAWKLIERAKTYHKRENHQQAKESYEKACKILNELSIFNYESVYFSAWIVLEEAEQLSKQEKHEEAIERFNTTIKIFENATKMLKKAFNQSRNKIEKERIDKLEDLAKIRMKHCSARINIEKARILGKQGEHLPAAGKFATAASEFKIVCNRFKIEKERQELEAVYYLCRAWESMEFAENYEDSNRFAEAADLFTKASKLFSSNKMKLLALGNSSFCQALKYGCKFDETAEANTKAEIYPKVKMMLRKATTLYSKGGFENGADWALATSTYFDAAWHLIRADKEMRLAEKKELLELGSKILKSASELFAKSGYKEKEKEIIGQLDLVKKEEKILISALNTIKEPKISKSTMGIVAPACPLETSQSPKLGEVYQLTEEARMAKIGREKKEESDNIKVFLSYATVDSNMFYVSRIAKELLNYPEIEHVLYWEEDLHDDIYDYMDTNLGQCDVFLLFCSTNALKSDAVKMEWRAALKIKKKIIPIFIRERDIPTLLSTKLGVHFNESDIEDSIKNIYDLILKKLEI